MVGSPNLAIKLTELQRQRGYTDLQMAELLGCSRQLYQKTRSLAIPLGSKVLRGIIVAFPELKGEAIYFLTNGDRQLADIAKNLPTLPETAQNGKIARFRALCGRLYHWLIGSDTNQATK